MYSDNGSSPRAGASLRAGAAHAAESAAFDHGDGADTRTADMLRGATRYLCGAAYTDVRFADATVAELVEDEHRAVIPSDSVELDPVVRHCLHARRRTLSHAGALSAVLLVAVVVAPYGSAIFLALAVTVAVPLGLRRRAKLTGWKLTLIALLSVWILPAVVLVGVLLLRSLIPGGPSLDSLTAGLDAATTSGSGTSASGTPASEAPIDVTQAEMLAQALLLAAVAFGLLTWSRFSVLHTLTHDLAPDAPYRPPPVGNARVTARLAALTTAQRGNIVMYSGNDPFLAAGEVQNAWSMVLDLRTLASAGAPGGAPAVGLDPVALHRHLRRRLAALRRPPLPDREQLSGLTIRDLLVLSGERPPDYPLLDPDRRPYPCASTETVEAVIRHPQASARHFLRVSTGTEGKPVLDRNRYELVPPEDQEVEVSAFVHVAVEGGMFYLEYVSTVLGPVRDEYHEMDRLPTNSGDLLRLAMGHALRRLATGTASAPVLMLRGLGRQLVLRSRMDTARRTSLEAPAYDYGAHTSVRRLASVKGPDTFVRALDAQKYGKLIEKRVVESVLDFFEDQGLDTAEYRTRMNVIYNEGTMITNSTINAPVASAAGATATMSGGPAAA